MKKHSAQFAEIRGNVRRFTWEREVGHCRDRKVCVTGFLDTACAVAYRDGQGMSGKNKNVCLSPESNWSQLKVFKTEEETRPHIHLGKITRTSTWGRKFEYRVHGKKNTAIWEGHVYRLNNQDCGGNGDVDYISELNLLRLKHDLDRNVEEMRV